MIGKITKGANFSGCINYVLGKEDAELLVGEGVLTDDINTITNSFQTQRMMKPNIQQPVGHISLSYAPEDAYRLTNKIMIQYALQYMEKMGIKDTQYIIARHHDQKHPHIHLVYNRVNNNGEIISDKNDRYRNMETCKELKIKHALYFGKSKDRVRTHRLKGEDKIKYEIYHALNATLSKTTNWKIFCDVLERQGIETVFKYKGRSDFIQGVSFIKDGITFKASEIDRCFSFSKMDQRLGEASNSYEGSYFGQLAPNYLDPSQNVTNEITKEVSKEAINILMAPCQSSGGGSSDSDEKKRKRKRM